MLGEYNNIIVHIFESIAKGFTNLSCKASEVLDDDDNVVNGNQLQRGFYIIIGSVFMLIYSLVGFIWGVFRLLFHLVSGRSLSTFQVQKGYHSTPTIKRFELLVICLICVAVYASLYWLCNVDWAKNTNLYYYNSRYDINNICLNDFPSINSSDEESYIFNMRKVLETQKTSNAVYDMRNMVNDSLPEGLHFATVSDYLVTLMSLEHFDVLDRCAELDYFSGDKNNGNAGLFHNYLENICKDYFNYGQFYKSETCLDLIFKFSKYGSVTNSSDYNNSFYLMRLFNENIMDRYISCNINNDILKEIVSNVSNIGYLMDNFKFRPAVSQHEGEIIEYISALDEFHKGYQADYRFPFERFMRLHDNTKSDVLRQYSLYMALRSQSEQIPYNIRHGVLSGKQADRELRKWQQILNRCKNEITYPYLLNTMYCHEQDYLL